MASKLRNVSAVGLVTGCAWLLAIGCGSSNKKKAGPGEDSAGAAGAAGSSELTPQGGAAGSSPVESNAGAAGQGDSGAGGAAGAAGQSAAGAAGSLDSAGAGGEGSLACLPQGNVTGLTVGTDGFLKVCRGARALASFSATVPDRSFTCCGASDSAPEYEVTLGGLSNGEGGGELQFVVPKAAPLGEQAITLTCSPGPASTFDIEVVDTLPPLVTGADTSVFPSDDVHITGSHLLGVTEVVAVPVDGSWSRTSCYITGDSSDTSVICNFDGVNPGSYYLYVGETDCGYALEAPILEVKQPI